MSSTFSDRGALLLRTLRRPQLLESLSLSEWDCLLPQARATGVLGRLADRAAELTLDESLPPEVLPHLDAARLQARRQETAIRWETDRIQRALRGLDAKVVALKGTAYLMAGLATSRGRTYRDVDILVERERMADVQQALRRGGWVDAERDPLHRQYFQQWLHELPPMRHVDRKITIDVHHSILPRTDTLRLDASMLLDAARRLDGSTWLVLQPVDMILHCATHLFRNGDFRHGLRDLSDLDGLVRQFSGQDGFWRNLLARAGELDLRLPCYCGLHFARQFFATEIPAATIATIEKWRPRWPLRPLVNRLVPRAALPGELSGADNPRYLAIAALAYWPVPRLRAMTSAIFWTKRLPRPLDP